MRAGRRCVSYDFEVALLSPATLEIASNNAVYRKVSRPCVRMEDPPRAGTFFKFPEVVLAALGREGADYKFNADVVIST